jgi:hypothetical protein
MQRSPPDRREDGDFERTDALPSSALEDTGTIGLPFLPALPADMADLAETLREQEQQLEQERQRVASLEEDLETLKQRCLELHRECEDLRAAKALRTPAAAAPAAVTVAPVATPPAVVPPVVVPPVIAPRRPSTITATAGELAELRRQNERLHEALTTVQGLLGVREAMLAEAEEAQRRISRMARTVEQPGHAEWQVRCAELNQALERERAASLERAQVQESRLAALEVELDAVRVRLQAPAGFVTAEEPPRSAQPRPATNVLRVLVREENGSELVYPLGRHTTIGRTPDNDIQVDASWISRHHAVLLAGMDHCIVEDLNSTNGLMVNGHRVSRQVLHDGDTVTIGKTHFRYQQRA